MILDPEKYWDARVLEYEATPQALGWSSRYRQEERFEVLSQVITKTGTSILDVGCGFGDLLLFLKRRGWDGFYTGLDISQKILNIAKQKVPEGTLIRGDISEMPILKDYDYVLLSGTLNNRLFDEDFRQVRWVEEIIKKMWEGCKIAVAFNLRSAWGLPPRSEDIFAYDPIEVLKFCRDLTPRLRFDHSYFPHDFTIQMFKGGYER